MSASSSPRARWFLRIALVLGALLVALGGAELAARRILPPSWYLVPRERRPRDVPVLAPVGPGLHWIRAGLPEPADGADEVRILFLGDSFTYGSGLADESAVFVRRIERALNAAPPVPGRRYVCFNAGIPGSMTYDWVTLFEDAAAAFRPHLVVPVFFLRNGQFGSRSIGEIGKMTEQLEARHAASALFRHSRLVRFFEERAAERRLGREYLGEMETGYVGSAAETEEWKQTQLNLLMLRARTERAGAAFGLVVFPVLFGLSGDYVLQRTVDEILAAADAHALPTLSLLPAFSGRRAESLWVSKSDQHPNEAGHALAADALLPFVIERLAEVAAVAPAWPGAESPDAMRDALPDVPVDPALEQAFERYCRARGVELERLQQELLARGADLAPLIARALDDAERTPPALTLLAALEGPAFAAALPAFLAAAERNGCVALGSSLPDTVLGADAAPHVAAGLARPVARVGTLIVLGRLDMYGKGLRSSWPLLGDAAPAIVEQLLGAEDERLERVTTIALGRLGAPAAEALAPRLASATATQRARAATALGYLGPQAPPDVVAALVERLQDPDDAVRAAAARALWQIAPVSAPARPALERAAAADAAPEVRLWAGRALAELDEG
jgi:hypothetical protein